MERLELSQDLLGSLIGFMLAKKYPFNTRRQYRATLNKLFKDYSYLDREVVRKILPKFKHQNQRAVLSLINQYCHHEDIDFRVLLPRMSRRKRETLIKTLSETEVSVMINSAPKPYDLALRCVYKIGAGLRVNEIIKLSWGHFKWVMWLEDGKGWGAVEIKESKGDARLCRVPESLMKELYAHAQEKKLLNEFRIPTGGQIFHFGSKAFKPELMSNNLDRWKDEYLKFAYDWFRHNIIKNHCEKALGHRVNIHQLRHTRATELLEKYNQPLEIIQDQLGHKEIGTTMIYAKLSKKKVFDNMEGVN